MSENSETVELAETPDSYVSALRDLYKNAVSEGQYGLGFEILKEIAEFEGHRA